MAGAAISTAPINAAQLLAAARAEASATTSGPLAQLAAQIAAQNKQNSNAVKDVSGYFKGLGNYVNTATGQVRGIGSGLTNQLGQLGTQEQGQLQGISTGAQNLDQSYLPKGDTDVGAAGQQSLANALAQQQGYAGQEMAGMRAVGANQSANYNDLMQSLKVADATQGRQDLTSVSQAGQSALAPLTQKAANLESQNAALTDSDLVKLRQQEITNHINESALGIKQEGATTASQNAKTASQKVIDQYKYQIGQLQNTAAKTSAQASYQQGLLGIDTTKADTAAGEAASQNAYRQAEANLDNAKAKGGNGGTPLTANENNTMLDELGRAVAASKQLSTKNPKTGKSESAQQIANTLTSGNAQLSVNSHNSLGQPTTSYTKLPALPEPVVQAALEYNQTGQISHDTWVQLHQMGIHNLPFKVAAPKGK